jgi:hypothetical protein
MRTITHTTVIRLAGVLLAGVMAAACTPHAYGASLGAQLVAGGATSGDGTTWHVLSGAGYSTWTDDIQAKAAAKATVINLGSGMLVNQAATWKGDRGWTATDEAIVSWTVASIPKATCVDLVLPGVAADNVTGYPGLYDQVAEARAWAKAVIAPKADHVLDWKPWVDAHPASLADGIHLGDQAAVDAYYALTTSGCLR